MSPWERARCRWLLLARTSQLTPPGDWFVWLLRGGKGSGKTRAGAEDIAEHMRTTPDARVALLAPTFSDARDTMVEGVSGLLSVIPDSALRRGSRDGGWNRSVGELWCANGARARCFSSERPSRIRGKGLTRAWVDEPAELLDARFGDALDTSWNNLMLALREGESPRVVVTGTPKPLELLRHLDATADVISQMSTFDNLDNLSPRYKATVLDRYIGTRLERQEIHGEMLDEVEGALWTWETIEAHRVAEAPTLVRVVVGVDPGGGPGTTGIVVVGIGDEGHLYVLADLSTGGSPETWARVVADAREDFAADRVVAERNFGYDMVASVLRTVDPNLPVKMVNASRGKAVRAEPVAAMAEQGRLHHVGTLPRLETQLTTWVPGDPSPDHLDAMVWACTELMARRRHRYEHIDLDALHRQARPRVGSLR